MKTVNNYISRQSKNFELKLNKVLPSVVETIDLQEVGMRRASGYGSYNYYLDCEINGVQMTLSRFTNDSCSWDAYKDMEENTTYDNWCKNTALALLKENEWVLVDKLTEVEQD